MGTIDVARIACAQRWRALCKKISPFLGMLLATLLLCAGPVRADDIEYAYDELGRLVQASNLTSGEAVLYTYDAAGNITSQTTRPLTTLSIGHFTPSRGPIGTQVTIHGTGFSATPASNLVRFNGTAAAVLSASQTRVVASVPATATTGAISVEVGASMVTSAVPFIVTATGDAPTITALLPGAAPAGSSISIVGTNFEPVPTQNRVRLGNALAQVISSTATTINVVVPPNSSSGRVRVTTPRGVAVSLTDFIVVPPGYSASQIASTERIVSDGTATTLVFPTAWKIGLRLFEGNAGELLTVGVSSMSLASCMLRVYAPDGKQLAFGPITASGQGLQLPKLPATGTYTILVDVGSSTGSISLGVFKPVEAALTLNGAATNVSLTPPGRRALLTFNGTQGAYANVAVGGVAFAGTVSVLSPTGAVLMSAALSSTGTAVHPLLPRTGTYSILLDPTGSVGGTAAVSVAESPTPTLVANTGAHSINLNNQTPVSVTFRGEPGQYMSIVVGATSTTWFSVSAAVRNPDGSSLTSTAVNTGFQGGSTFRGSRILNFGPLQFGGTYSVVVQQTSAVSGTVGLTLTTASTGTLAVNSSASAEITLPGQSVLRSFQGSAGQFLSFAVGEQLGGISGAKITVLRPDGSVAATGDFTPPLARCGVISSPGNPVDPVFRCGRAVVNMGTLPVTGIYQVLVQQTDSLRVEDDYAGTLALALSEPVSSTLVVDGSGAEPTTGLLGQGMKFTFAGTQGQYLAAGIVSTAGFLEGVVSNPVTAVVLDPEGTAIAAGGFVVTRRGGSGGGSIVGWLGSGVVNMDPLSVSGTYTLLLLQSGQAYHDIISAEALLSTPLTGSLTTSSPAVAPDVQRSGQGLLYYFPCAAGEYVSGALAASSGDITAAKITVLGANGAPLASRDMATVLRGGAAGSYEGSTVVNAGPIPAAGTCALLVQQTGSGESNAGQLSLRWSPVLTGTLDLDAQMGVEVENSGQGLLYSFDANAGDYRAITVSVDDYMQSATVSVLSPSGSVVATGNLTTVEMPGSLANPPTYEGAVLLNVGPLNATGTYKLLVQQTGSGSLQTGGLGIVLSAPVSGSVTVGGSADANIGLRGQGARYTFTGSAGQHLSLRVSESIGRISSASVKILDPEGAVLKSGTLAATAQTCSGCGGYVGNVTVDSGLLPVAGTYSVLLQQTSLPPFDTEKTTPYLGGVGTLTMELTELQPGTGSTTNISTTVPGQVASVNFNAAAGQTVSVAFSNPVLSPASATTYWINLYAPNGAHVASASCWSPQSCDVLHVRQLPQTGTYRVDVTPPSTHTISGTLTIASALTGALTPSVPFSATMSGPGQSAHLSFTATQGQTFALALSSLSTTPANTRMWVNVYNAGGGLIVNTSLTSSLATYNLPNLAAGTYYVWLAPQYPATSTMQVTLHPRVGGTLQTDGTASNFSTTAPGQAAYFEFAATAGQSMSLAIQNVVLTPSDAGSYYIYVFAPNGAQVGFVNCYTGWGVCDVIHMRNLAHTGTYRVEIYTPATQTLGGTLTVSQNLTGSLTTGAPATFSLNNVGQGVHLSFTATAGETVALALSSLSTTPANSHMHMNVYNAAGALVANSSTTSSNLTFNLPNLAAGTYYVWIAPRYPVTSSMQVTLHPRAGGTVTANGTPANFSTTAFGQTAYFEFAATAGQSMSVAIQNVALTPNVAASYYLYVYAPDGAQVGFVNCYTGWGVCDVIHMRNLAQSGTYRMELHTPATQTMSGTLTVAQNVTGTLSTAAPVSLNLSKVGQGAHLTFTATAGQTFALALSSVTTTPANSPIHMNVYNAAGQLLYNSSTTTPILTFNLRDLAADTYFVWIAPRYPVTSTAEVRLHPMVGGTVTADGSPTNFSTTAAGQTAYFEFAASAGQSMSVAIQNVALTPNVAGSYYLYVYAPNGTQVGFVNCYTGWGVCDVIHMRNLPQTGTYRTELYPPATQTLSGTLTVSQNVTGTLSTAAPMNLDLNEVGQGAHLTFTATAGQTFALALSSLSRTPPNSRVYMNVYNAAGGLIANSSTTTANLTLNLPKLAAGTYYAWIVPQYPVTSTVDVTLHPGVGGTVTTDGTPVSFNTPALGQIAYYEFAATTGQDVSVSLAGVAASPSSPAAQYYASVFAPSGGQLGWIGCWSTWTTCDVLHLRNLPQTGTYRVEVSTYATHTISGSLTVALGQTGSLNPDVPLDLTLNAVGQTAELSFTTTASQTVSLHLGPLSTVPANTRMYVHVYNAAGTYFGSMNSTVGASLVLPNLPAGTYYAWVLPQYPATSTVQMTMRPAVAVPTDGTSTSFDTTALGQSRSFTFSGTAGGNVSIALNDIVASPGTSPVQYWFAVFRPDGQNVWTNSCWSNWTACDVLHLRDLAQTGTYRIDISVAATATLSGTLTLTQALTGTLTSGVPVNVTLPLVGQTMLFDMTLSAAQPVSVTGTSISTTPAGRPMQIYVFNPSGSLIASNSGTTGVTVNMGTLAAGSYKVWVVPQYPSTSSLVVGY